MKLLKKLPDRPLPGGCSCNRLSGVSVGRCQELAFVIRSSGSASRMDRSGQYFAGHSVRVFHTMVLENHFGRPRFIIELECSVQLFGVSQIGKYIPGGVWNIVAAAEIGRNHRIPARRSVTAMTVAVLISLLSGTGIGAVTVLGTSVTIQVPTWAIIVLLIILVALLTPPVLNRLIGFGFKLLKRPAPEHRMTFKGLGLATLLAIIAWGVAGVQVWLLAVGFGMSPSVSGLLLAVGAYALAWVVGFLAVFMPAGTGVREGILSLFFTGVLSSGGVLAVVLVSRIAMTVADLVFAGTGALLLRGHRNNKAHQ